MRVLILGGCGFIGSHLVDRALQAGLQVRVFSRRAETLRAPLAEVEYRLADLADTHALTDAMKGCDAVVHLVSASYPVTAEQNPIGDVSCNLIGTLRLLQAMRDTGPRRLVFLSSGGAIYGPPDILPVPESHPLRPIGSYGVVKAAIESYIRLAARHGLVATVIRPANVFGTRQVLSGNPAFVSTALQRLALDQPLEIYGDGSVVRDYLPVADLVSLCLRTLDDAAAGLTVNAGSGSGRSLLQVLDTIARVTGRQPRLTHLPARPIDVPVSVLDIRHARERLGWMPLVKFEDALAETWEHVRSVAG